LKRYGIFKDEWDDEEESQNFDTNEYYRHYMRTKRNFMDALVLLISQPKQGHLTSIAANQDIIINEVILNKACSVAHIWFDVVSALPEDEKKVLLTDIQRRLKRAAGYLAGQIVQMMHLRYAPDLRFYIDTKDTEYNEFLARLEKKLHSGNPGKMLEEEIENARKLTPDQIQQIKNLLPNNEEREKFAKAMSRKNLEAKLKEAREQQVEAHKILEEIKNMPKISKHKQKHILQEQKFVEQTMKESGLDPEKHLNPKEQDFQEIADEMQSSFKYKIPNKKREKKIDSEGNRVRKHPRDKNGKKIRTKSKKARQERFWDSVNNI